MDPRFAFEVGSAICLQTTIVIAVTFALQHWITDARWGCRLWTACFICVLGLIAAALLLPHRRLFDFPGELSREGVLSVVTWQSRIGIGLTVVWGAGVVVSLLRRAVLCVGLIRFLSHDCEAVDATEVLDRGGLAGNPQTQGVRPRSSSASEANAMALRLLVSDKIQSPFCWQLHCPVIVLPSFLLDEDNATLQHVLLHELAHLRTQHPMQHFLQGVCSTLFWFHPLVWRAARGAELAREFLCDELAAKTAGRFGDYLRTLARIAERCGSVPCTGVPKGTLAFGNQKNALIRRSNRLVELAEGGKPASRRRPIAAMAALMICAGLMQQVWLPTNAMASQRSDWSPWPTWTANALHQINVQVRDFELFEERVQMHELLYDEN